MDEPPRKRRKTTSPAQQEASPLRKPPRRPSFASPTKASLARNYPDLLPGRKSSRDYVEARGEQALKRTFEAPDTPKKVIGGEGEEGEEEAEIRSSPPPRHLPEQQRSRQDLHFLSPDKRPPGPIGALRRSPLAPAPAVRHNQLARPLEDAFDEDGQKERAKRPALDLEVEKRRQEKARLEHEIRELEGQISGCTSEIAAGTKRNTKDGSPPTQQADLIKLITKTSGADEQEERPIPISSLLCSFLPYSSFAIPPPKRKHSEKPIATHRPVDLPDPLPYLEMFTAFKFSTQLGLPRGKVLPSSKRVHQKHTIDITGPQKLLTVQLDVTIDCLSNEAIDMHVLRLPPWTERELGTFMRSKAKSKNLGIVCWAIDSFWDISTKRAAYWHKCETAFARLLPEQTTAGTENTRLVNAAKPNMLSRKDLGRHLGRDMLILKDKHVLLKINWRIEFDWTGEAESCVDAECAVPAVWKEADASDTFRKIPETFSSLLRTKGAFEATRILVALLFSQ